MDDGLEAPFDDIPSWRVCVPQAEHEEVSHHEEKLGNKGKQVQPNTVLQTISQCRLCVCVASKM